MKTVLYTDDMEPITVVEIGPWATTLIERHGHVQFDIPEPLNLKAFTRQEPYPLELRLRMVTVYGEQFVRKGVRQMMLFTRDEENALLLQSAFLPRQQRAVNEGKAGAFARGFLQGLRAIG